MTELLIKDTSDRGRGVFATKDYQVGDIIEVCPVIVLTPQERKILEGTILDWYIYPWTSLEDAAAVLGQGMMYNHSNTPNADYNQDFPARTMVYQAVRPIKAGDEITINYGINAEDSTIPEWVFEMPNR